MPSSAQPEFGPQHWGCRVSRVRFKNGTVLTIPVENPPVPEESRAFYDTLTFLLEQGRAGLCYGFALVALFHNDEGYDFYEAAAPIAPEYRVPLLGAISAMEHAYKARFFADYVAKGLDEYAAKHPDGPEPDDAV